MSQEQVVLITGVSSGIGSVTAALLAKRGFRVYGTQRNPAGASPDAATVAPLVLDVRDEDSVRSCVETILEREGRIDALVNNAGYALIGSAEETSMEEAQAIFETNFFGVLRTCKAVLPAMRRQGRGRIVNVGSILGFLPAPYMSTYAATKHAIEGFSESLDHEVRQFGIRVSVIEPAFTRTNLGRNGQLVAQPLSAYSADRDSAFAAIREGVAKGAAPSAVAAVVLEALTSRSPRLRYPVGSEAKLLGSLRKFAPAKLLDKGLRKQFGLNAA